MKLALIIVLAVVFIKTVLIRRVYNLVSIKELKRRARAKNRQASDLYKVVALGGSLDILLWLSGIISFSVVIIAAAQTAWWLAAGVIILAGWLLFFAPKPREGGWLWTLTAWKAPYLYQLISWLNPALRLLSKILGGNRAVHMHTGYYEKEDLLELIDNQSRQADSRIPEEELKIIRGALTFGDKKVSDCMTPRRTVRFVAASEAIGPMIMDELHKTGFSRFPVIKESRKNSEPEVIGTLLLKDLVGREEEGTIADVLRRGVYFINEACDLRQALDAILKNHDHLLVVVNNFEEVVGVISLEDILEQIIGSPIIDEFDKYDDMRAVAGLQARADRSAHHHEVKASEPPQSVVE